MNVDIKILDFPVYDNLAVNWTILFKLVWNSYLHSISKFFIFSGYICFTFSVYVKTIILSCVMVRIRL